MSTLSSSLDTREKLNVQSRSMPKPSLGMLYAISVPLAAGFVHLCEFRVGGLMVSGYVWMLMLAIGLLIFLLDNALTSRRRISFPWIAWMPFASFVWLSLVWGKVDRETIQAACQITMPIFVGVIVSVFVRSEEQLVLLLRAFRWSLVFLAAGFVVSYARVRGDLDGVGFRMGSLTCILIGANYLTSSSKSRVVAWSGWLTCLAMAGVCGARMATLAILVMPILRPEVGKFWAKLAAVLAMLALGVGIFHTPHFQERFFHGGEGGSLQDVFYGKLNTSGRFEAWPLIWDKALEHPLIGAGIGASGPYSDVVSNLGGHPHNDYLRVFFDLGSVGSVFFFLVIIWQSASLLLLIRLSEGPVKHAFEAAWLGWIMFLFTSCTDNTLVYCAAYMNPLFALIGAGYSIFRQQRHVRRTTTASLLSATGGDAR